MGVDSIDTDAAARCGVAVGNVPDYCVEEVASLRQTVAEGSAAVLAS